jgi:argininosuccinate lyase
MLARQGIIAQADLDDIERGMAQIEQEIEAGSSTGTSTTRTCTSISRSA